jgi:hypothetical protein
MPQMYYTGAYPHLYIQKSKQLHDTIQSENNNMVNSEADLSDGVAPSVVRLKPKMLEFPSPGFGPLTEDPCPPNQTSMWIAQILPPRTLSSNLWLPKLWITD